MKKLILILILITTALSNLAFAEVAFLRGGKEGIKLQDELGVNYGIKHIDNKPRVSSMPYLYDIAEGNIVDHEPIRRYGHNNAVSTSLETVYHVSNLKTYLTSAERLQVVSDDVDDDGDPVDTGARTIRIDGLDTDHLEISEVVTMNGTTNVLTDASFLRILTVTTITAGSSGYNEGTITVSNNADTIVLDQIDPIENESHCACFTIPAGHTGYVTQAMATEASSKGSEFSFWIREPGGLWIAKRSIVLLDSAIITPMMLPEKTDIEIRVQAILAGAIVTAGFEGWIEAN